MSLRNLDFGIFCSLRNFIITSRISQHYLQTCFLTNPYEEENDEPAFYLHQEKYFDIMSKN